MGEISERAAVRRLHDRLGFGPVAGAADQGFDTTVERLLTGADPKVPPPPGLTPPEQPKKDDQAGKKAAAKQRAAQELRLTAWWLDRMVTGQSATERLTWFWHGHFATSGQKVRSAQLMWRQNETFRTHALGKFGDLAQAVVVDPAMIRWLDGNDNRKGSPNENLAREFLELFTLGIGHYTEVDVFQGARCLTGWVVRRDAAEARFVKARYDAETKTLFGKAGAFDAHGFVGQALAQSASAPFVIGRLWFRLVSPTPPSAETLRRLVATYGAERDVRAVLRAMVAEPAFTDSASALVKQPVEWAVGLLRALKIQPARLDEKTRVRLIAGLRGLGQVPFRPPSVGGWPAGASWLTTSAGVARLQVAQLLARKADLAAIEDAKDKAAAVQTVLGVDGWSDRTRSAFTGLSDPAQLTAIAACAPEYVVSG
ncbi:uncharacterized protein (DUF1800 family) [Kribbella amoyensis]|uniref:Uncharacterized protein (DUF1800 family) n=1 Tax=Kribbella amoyensis TaxID=996641 RepID=A0A561BM68_9ACTN|nr:DUF1800 domain-containing protein [Kribbella amoyensis]TWD79971.1 uncharacterized protein (DUF1800 family) [Kribbella amoyensis]